MPLIQEQNYTRKRFIEDAVTSYIRNNPREYTLFVSQLNAKRASLLDKEFGQLNKDGKTDQDSFRLAFSFPEKLWNVFDTILDGKENNKFGDEKGEMRWFAKKYPEFLVPKKY